MKFIILVFCIVFIATSQHVFGNEKLELNPKWIDLVSMRHAVDGEFNKLNILVQQTLDKGRRSVSTMKKEVETGVDKVKKNVDRAKKTVDKAKKAIDKARYAVDRAQIIAKVVKDQVIDVKSKYNQETQKIHDPPKS